jgi:hypothetical protein
LIGDILEGQLNVTDLADDPRAVAQALMAGYADKS